MSRKLCKHCPFAGRGVDHPRSKLTARQVSDMLAAAQAGRARKQLAADFGVSTSTISRYLSRARVDAYLAKTES